MEEHNLDIVFYVDSDVLLFTNANEEWEKYKQFDITLLHRTAATSSFITKRAIDNFCNFLINTYINKTSYEYKKIESHFMVRRDCGLPGGVCDMTFLDYFHYHFNVGGGPGRVGEMMTIIDGSTYDHNINAQDQDFELSNGIKNIKVINKVPYVFNIKLNQDIKLNAIHFQGNAKHLIKQYYQLTT